MRLIDDQDAVGEVDVVLLLDGGGGEEVVVGHEGDVGAGHEGLVVVVGAELLALPTEHDVL